jgi:hypothetical protein
MKAIFANFLNIFIFVFFFIFFAIQRYDVLRRPAKILVSFVSGRCDSGLKMRQTKEMCLISVALV